MTVTTDFRFLFLVLLGVVAWSAGPCRAQIFAPGGLGAGDVLVRGRIIGMIPYDQHSRIDIVGGHIDTKSMVLPDVDVSYFITDHIALDGETGILRTKIEARDTLVGRLPIAETWSVPVSLAAQYHFAPGGLLNPYVGAGINANFFFGERPAGGYVTAVKISPQTGVLLEAGLDYRLSDHWFANVEARQIFFPAHTLRNGDLGGAKVSLDTLILGAGIGYRF